MSRRSANFYQVRKDGTAVRPLTLEEQGLQRLLEQAQADIRAGNCLAGDDAVAFLDGMVARMEAHAQIADREPG